MVTSRPSLKRSSGQKDILPQLESNRCAHIIIFEAPETDSEMVVNVSPDAGGKITTFKGLGPCCRDIRPSMAPPKLPGLKLFPRRPPFPERPFARPPSAQPKDNNAPGPNLENSPNHLRP